MGNQKRFSSTFFLEFFFFCSKSSSHRRKRVNETPATLPFRVDVSLARNARRQKKNRPKRSENIERKKKQVRVRERKKRPFHGVRCLFGGVAVGVGGRWVCKCGAANEASLCDTHRVWTRPRTLDGAARATSGPAHRPVT